MCREIEDKTKNCVACVASVRNFKYQIPKNNLKTLTEQGQEIQIDFTGKLNHKKLNGGHQILIATDRFSKWPTVTICKSSETKEVLNFLEQNFNLYGLSETIKTDSSGYLSLKNTETFVNRKKIEIYYSTPRLHTGTAAVERAIQTSKTIYA